ncbi:uncharacterized protein LOC106076819 [Biomphalaria glabrata]|uniref:Uncharacterized protein LOC106076819 n=1 Tax=Biomphalaria glabrata TaxID=6526 RepID=A0A9W2ZB81_BIOGL|nr:uncharacterized protein LOC106076819 [Biomphalaria glabrata]
MHGPLSALLFIILSLLVSGLPGIKAADNCRPKGNCDTELSNISKDKLGCFGLEKLKSCFNTYCTAIDYDKAYAECNKTDLTTLKASFGKIQFQDCLTTTVPVTGTTGTAPPTTAAATTVAATTAAATTAAATTAAATTTAAVHRKRRALAASCATLKSNVDGAATHTAFYTAFDVLVSCINTTCPNQLTEVNDYVKQQAATIFVKTESQPECKTCGAQAVYLASILFIMMAVKPFIA